MPGAVAPSVSPDAIGLALQQAYAEWEHLKRAALNEAFAVRVQRGWAIALRPLRELLEV
jgi:hypothetical protein